MEDSLAHTKWDCTYHIVWIPKYRKKVMYGEVRKELIEIMKTLMERRRLELVEGAMCSDHVHISIRIPPKEAVSDVVGYLKGKSALMFFDRHPEYRKRFWMDKTLWARGYYVSTAGAIFFNMENITDFLYWIGSVFAPMIAILIADFFVTRHDSSSKKIDIKKIIVWLFGFVLYRVLMKFDFVLGCTVLDMAITFAATVILKSRK